uniref:AlNc14C149G7468 protein n=1 Tax=Albugo laibachii Nc14 TaxID=890382 RepID=F0WLV5_9STRA|nr:AlNc14C149G7468 [Albugo laibachii Nc14]|eukprot:CCA22281.1 AlNc14C149G7468 [Albugo laibachii Nc14]
MLWYNIIVFRPTLAFCTRVPVIEIRTLVFLSSWSNQRILVHEIITNEGAKAENSANQNHVETV